jgi:hypothetical protein
MKLVGVVLWVTALLIAMASLPVQSFVVEAQQVVPKDGALAVDVTWGDTNNTPATNVYVEAYGFVPRYRASKAFVLRMSDNGHYEAALPAGIYDVFVSEGSSVPRCRRILIQEGLTSFWTLKLEIDDVYNNKFVQRNR